MAFNLTEAEMIFAKNATREANLDTVTVLLDVFSEFYEIECIFNGWVLFDAAFDKSAYDSFLVALKRLDGPSQKVKQATYPND